MFTEINVLGKAVTYCPTTDRFDLIDIFMHFFEDSKSGHPCMIKKLTSNQLKHYVDDNPDSIIIENSGKGRRVRYMATRKVASLYVQWRGGPDHPAINVFGFYEYFPFDYIDVAGVRIRKDGDYYCLSDAANEFGMTYGTYSAFLSRTIDKHKSTDIKDAVVRVRDINGYRAKSTNKGIAMGLKHVLIDMFESYMPDLADDLRSVVGDSERVIITRKEYSFGKDIVYNLFSGYEILSQYRVLDGKYKIDWYIPELKIAIEFDESHHSNGANVEQDKIRQREIESELGCKFLRYTDK